MKTQKSHIQYVKKGKYCICNGNIILLWASLLLFSVVFQFVLLLFQKSIKKTHKSTQNASWNILSFGEDKPWVLGFTKTKKRHTKFKDFIPNV